jgi:hypothetical protein
MKTLIAFIIASTSISIAYGKDSNYPKQLYISCGKLDVHLDASKFWNINGVKYDNLPVSVDLKGAHWGTVFKFPEIGFIGSGHTENETEKSVRIKIYADGKYIPPEEAAKTEKINCSEFKMLKEAQVKDIVFKYSLILKDNNIFETCNIKALKKTPLALMYNFMHPWSEKMTDYYVQTSDNKSKQGAFKTDNTFSYTGKFTWVSLYNKGNNAGIVSKAEAEDSVLFLWDRKQYKKCYLCSFKEKDLPAEQDISYKMTTAFFISSPEEWLETAKDCAKNL